MKKTDLPDPIYAAAGAGEYAYQQLRKLPEVAARTARTAGETAGEFRQRLNIGDRPLGARVRESAERSRVAVISTANAAQERATSGYRNLVARGERVVEERLGNGRDRGPSQVEVEVGPVQPATPAPPAPVATATPDAPIAPEAPMMPEDPIAPVASDVPEPPVEKPDANA